jgi:transposase-like protein
MATDVDRHELAQQLMAQAKEQGIELVGPEEIRVPRETGSSFDPKIVKKRQRA